MRMRLLYIIAPVLGVLAGCGADHKSSSSVESAAAAITTAAASGGAVQTASGAASADASGAPASPAGTQLVVKADLRVEADDVDGVADRAMKASAALGGTTFSSAIELTDAPKASLVLKVPPANLAAFVAAVRQLGHLTGQSQDTEDVTNQIIDLDARVTTARASLDRMREFLGKTTTVAEAAAAEAEVTRRETTLEQLLAQQSNLAGRVAMVTVTVTIVRPLVHVAPPSEPPGFVDALRAGGRVTWLVIHGVLLGVAWSAPLLGALLVFAAPVAAVWRRRRRAVATATPAA